LLVSTAGNAAEQLVQVLDSVFSMLVRMGTGWVRKPDLTGKSGADNTSKCVCDQFVMSL
jgi:hypothetical protein